MKTKWLFPHRYRLLGWLLFAPSLLTGLAGLYAEFRISLLDVEGTFFQGDWGGDVNNLTDELAAIGIITGLLLIAFSRERVEDEMIGQLRLEALQWSVYANCIILAIAILTFYEGTFLTVMIYNMFTVLIVFIVRFRWLLHRHTNALLTL